MSPKCHFDRLQIWQNKCLRMVLSASYYTRITDLQRETKMPTISNYVQKISVNFYKKASYHSNILIKRVGDYSEDSLPFRVKHRMPKRL